MRGTIEELTEEDWKGVTLNVSRVLGPVRTEYFGNHALSNNGASSRPANGSMEKPPDFQSFALKPKPKTPKLIVKGPSPSVEAVRPVQKGGPARQWPPPRNNVCILDDADDVHVSVDSKFKPAMGELTVKPVEKDESTRRVTKPPARDRSYVYDDDDDDEEDDIQGSSEKMKATVQLGSGESDEAKPTRRRQLRVVSDDDSDDEYDPVAEQKNRSVKRPRRAMIDSAEDDNLEYPSKTNAVINLDDEIYGVKTGWSQTESKNVIMETLQKCERIAAVLRNDLHSTSSTKDGLNHYADMPPAKLVTHEEVQAACQMVGSAKEQMLSPYQLVGVNFLLLLYRKHLGGAILADEMGLGKTVQAIVFLALIKYLDGDSGPHLIVTPASVLENWQRELKKWCPAFIVVHFHGNERNSLKEELHSAARSGQPPPFHVFLTGYSLFERKSAASKDDRSMLKKWNWSCVLMDEAHLLKDRTSYRNRHLKSIAQHAKHRLMITGTPLQNDLQELWSLLEFMMPKIFKNCDFDGMLENKNGRKVVTADNMDLITHIKAILGPFVLRRVKADVMHQLTPKMHKVESLDMVQDQETAYKEALAQYRALAARSAGMSSKSLAESLPRRQVSSIFTHLRKLANHPLLVRRVYSNKDIEKLAKDCYKQGIFGRECTLERIKEELDGYSDYSLHRLCSAHSILTRQIKLTEKDALQSAKCQVLAKLLPELRKGGHRPLIFSQWTAMLDILEWMLQVMNIKYNRLDGGTQVSERQTLVDDYNNNSDIFAFLLSTRAGGQGLNLTGADTVIIHDVDFNPQMDRQAEDRCHRIGQSKAVTIYRLVTKGTVDENIFAIAQRKLVLDAVLESSGDVSATHDEKNNDEAKTMGQILSSILS